MTESPSNLIAYKTKRHSFECDRLFKPVGFYTNAPHLQRYYQAVTWLQTIHLTVGSTRSRCASSRRYC
ncbi:MULTISPECIES: DUF3160 domain-containing protein [unclassified Lentimonas]|uniref:DUF3160 domain-containing protein n=1 Tax=unclassified Lentimonas TaxID=2630993 RepID=UPI00138A000D